MDPLDLALLFDTAVGAANTAASVMAMVDYSLAAEANKYKNAFFITVLMLKMLDYGLIYVPWSRTETPCE